MPDTGFFGHVDDKSGSRISLLGVDAEGPIHEPTHRVWAGPDADHQAGILKVYYARGSATGRFYAVRGAEDDPATAVLHITGKNEVWLTNDGLTVRREREARGRYRTEEERLVHERDLLAMLKVDEEGGFLMLRGPSGTVEIDSNGITAHDSKADFLMHLVVDHPEDPKSEIRYVVTEGPEVGVFVRGTARLRAGKAQVHLPDHFAHVASAERLTVQLTARSDRSKRVAATHVSPREIVLRELGRGRGSYDVDWTVNGVRKGKEDFQVVRPRKERVPRQAFPLGTGARGGSNGPVVPNARTARPETAG